jgi:ATP synthase protein I
MNPDDDEQALKARRDRLAAELKARQPKPQAPAPSAADKSAGAAWSLATKAGSEFVAAILVGGAIGYALDFALHTKPAFTIVFFLLGVVAGVWNVIRATSPKGGGTAP